MRTDREIKAIFGHLSYKAPLGEAASRWRYYEHTQCDLCKQRGPIARNCKGVEFTGELRRHLRKNLHRLQRTERNYLDSGALKDRKITLTLNDNQLFRVDLTPVEGAIEGILSKGWGGSDSNLSICISERPSRESCQQVVVGSIQILVYVLASKIRRRENHNPD